MKWPWVSRRKYDALDQLRHEYADKLVKARSVLIRLHNMINRGEKPVRGFMREVEDTLNKTV